MEYALLANRVVSALTMEDTDHSERSEALDQAMEFIETMLRAEDFGKSLQISDDSYKSALAYSEGLQALRFSLPAGLDPNGQDPNLMVSELLSTAKRLRHGEGVANAALDQLSSFFRTVRDATLESGRVEIEKVSF
jgi:hypothetical protein